MSNRNQGNTGFSGDELDAWAQHGWHQDADGCSCERVGNLARALVTERKDYQFNLGMAADLAAEKVNNQLLKKLEKLNGALRACVGALEELYDSRAEPRDKSQADAMLGLLRLIRTSRAALVNTDG